MSEEASPAGDYTRRKLDRPDGRYVLLYSFTDAQPPAPESSARERPTLEPPETESRRV
jgi:hypothetical protein